jgi:ferredoxin
MTMFRNTIFTLFFVVVAFAANSALGFSTLQSTPRQDTSLNLFDGLKGAFSNEEMGAKKNEGLANGPNYNENVTVNGKKVQGAVVGQKLTVVAGRARVKIPVNCQKGDCGTCVVNMNGKKVKACQMTLPSGKCNIDTL